MVQYYQHTAFAEIDDATTELELYEVFYGLLGVANGVLRRRVQHAHVTAACCAL